MSITPLVDVVFLLLLFLFAHFHFSPEEAFIPLRRTAGLHRQTTSGNEIILTVPQKGMIRLNGKHVPSQSLKTELVSLRED